MSKFAFMIHPLDINDYARKFPVLGKLPKKVLYQISKKLPPIYTSDIDGVASKYNSVDGCFVGCPLTSEQMVEYQEEFVLNKIIAAGKFAEKKGARILGLGAMTSVIGDAGITVADHLNIAVTTGNSYTISVACEAAKKAALLMGKGFDNTEVLILGATGSIGAVCAQILARDYKYITLAARDQGKLERLAHRIFYQTGLSVRVTTEYRQALKEADVIVAVTSSVDAVIYPDDLKPGAVVCDVARPRDVSKHVALERNDVLVIEGGVVEVPGNVNFNFNFGYPEGLALACMAETMILALEERYESFTLGRDLSLEQVDEITKLANKHGFKLAGFRSFERAVDEKEIEKIRKQVQEKYAG